MAIDNLQKLRPPAIALIMAGSLNGLIGLFALFGGLFSGISGRETLPVNEVERIGYVTGIVMTDGASLLSLLLSPVIIYGAVRMMQGKNYRLARVAAILAMIPITSCCFLLGMPIGIWTLIILSKPEVRAAFNNETFGGNIHPPQPPQNW